MKQILTYLFSSSVILLSAMSCITANRYALNKQEANYVANSTLYRNVSIFYDNKAIRKMTTNGVYKVKISETNGAGSIHMSDTKLIKARAIEIAGRVQAGSARS